MPELTPLPSSLNICGIDWAIIQSEERWSALLEIGGEDGVDLNDDGQTDPDHQIISLRPGINLTRSWITLIHEILHVLEEYTSPDEDMDEPNEMFIEQIDSALFVFLRDTFGVGVK